MAKTPWVLAADNDPKLLPLLRDDPAIASSQDAHGYSTLHAAASYNHLDLIRILVNEFHVDVDIKDEDGETPLFVVETVAAAQVLVEEMKADLSIRNNEGLTAEQKIRSEGDYTTVADYLSMCGESRISQSEQATNNSHVESDGARPPPLPPNITMQLGTLEDEQSLGDAAAVDPGFRQRIEELAAREDFKGQEGQRQLKELITDAIRGVGNSESERDLRRRIG